MLLLAPQKANLIYEHDAAKTFKRWRLKEIILIKQAPDRVPELYYFFAS